MRDSSARASARAIEARMLPPAKIGQLMLGPIDQERRPQLRRRSRSALATPREPVRATRGKRSLVATPMLAVAAWSEAAARRMSGRRSSRSEGRPAGVTGGALGVGAARGGAAPRGGGPGGGGGARVEKAWGVV